MIIFAIFESVLIQQPYVDKQTQIFHHVQVLNMVKQIMDTSV